MNERSNHQPLNERASAERSSNGKRQYHKPGFQCEKVFETMALACGKIGPTSFSCTHNKKNS